MNWFIKLFGINKISSLDGEWFIDDNGFATFADGDISDDNHESLALSAIISDELILRRFFDKKLTKKDIQIINKDHPGFLNYMERGGEAREWMIKKHNWIRVHGSHFQLNKLDNDSLNRIYNFINEQLDDESNIDLYISDSTGKNTNFSLEQLDSAIESGDPISFLTIRLNQPEFLPSSKTITYIPQQNFNLRMSLAPQVRNMIGIDKYLMISRKIMNLTDAQIIQIYQQILSNGTLISQMDNLSLDQYISNLAR